MTLEQVFYLLYRLNEDLFEDNLSEYRGFLDIQEIKGRHLGSLGIISKIFISEELKRIYIYSDRYGNIVDERIKDNQVITDGLFWYIYPLVEDNYKLETIIEHVKRHKSDKLKRSGKSKQ